MYARLKEKEKEEDVTQTLYANIYQLESIGCTDRSEVGKGSFNVLVGTLVRWFVGWFVGWLVVWCVLAAGVSIFVADELCGLYRSGAPVL
ncbi:hypothetical protein M0802_003787 [Mischocyttarus mexicanus]|nr:hypothetical protein M0802_003787 [Mischocyttarus mexicanus]